MAAAAFNQNVDSGGGSGGSAPDDGIPDSGYSTSCAHDHKGSDEFIMKKVARVVLNDDIPEHSFNAARVKIIDEESFSS